jgi:hypothetical protein
VEPDCAGPADAGAQEPAPGLARAFAASLAGGARLALLRPVAPARFLPSPEVWVALILAELFVVFVVSFARVGTGGMFDLDALPRALVYVPLALLVGVVCARLAREPFLALRLPIVVAALGIWFGPASLLLDLTASTNWIVLHFPNAYYVGAYGLFGWWALALSVALARMVPARVRATAVAYGLLLLIVPAVYLPSAALWTRAPDPTLAAEPQPGVVAESAFYAQPQLLQGQLDALLPSRPGVEDVYVLTAALYAGEDVFMKEVEVIADLLRTRYDAAGRTVTLINNPKRAADVPIATLTSVRRALEAIAGRMDVAEDVLVLYLTSHGSDRHRLSVSNWPLRLDEIDPVALRAALDDAGIRWRVVIVSACYSGGFVDPLKDEHTLVITAASAQRQSFGCGAGSDFTYLAKALFDEELRSTLSFEDAFGRARDSISRREREQGFKPSEPQIHVGAAIRDKLGSVEHRLAGRDGAKP